MSYLATVQAVAYGTRHIIETLNKGGYAIHDVFVCGGGTKNPLFLQQHADATGCTLHLPQESEAVLLGSAMLAAVAAGIYGDIATAATAMCGTGRSIRPAGGKTAAYHDRKYEVYLRMYDDQMKYDKLMKASV
jgi:ribulose kinase